MNFRWGKLEDRYGKGSWAIVTGASDGIGKAFCYELAQNGFNIALISRSVSKMDQICLDIQQKFGVQTKIIQADFKNADKLEFYDQLLSEVKGLDISILVNNVGIAEIRNYLNNQNPQDIYDHITVNALSTLLLTRSLINKLIQRNKRCAVITISSCKKLQYKQSQFLVLGVYPVPFQTIYSATKAFQNYLSLSLNENYKEKIDFLSVRPSGVSTDMISNAKGPNLITPQQCAQSAIKALLEGKKHTFGHFKHK